MRTTFTCDFCGQEHESRNGTGSMFHAAVKLVQVTPHNHL